jgi:hypothetical protein
MCTSVLSYFIMRPIVLSYRLTLENFGNLPSMNHSFDIFKQKLISTDVRRSP